MGNIEGYHPSQQQTNKKKNSQSFNTYLYL